MSPISSFPMVEESVDEHKIGNEYLTEKQQQQLDLDEEALRETLEEEARAEKEWEERIRQERAHYELFRLEFGVASVLLREPTLEPGAADVPRGRPRGRVFESASETLSAPGDEIHPRTGDGPGRRDGRPVGSRPAAEREAPGATDKMPRSLPGATGDPHTPGGRNRSTPARTDSPPERSEAPEGPVTTPRSRPASPRRSPVPRSRETEIPRPETGDSGSPGCPPRRSPPPEPGDRRRRGAPGASTRERTLATWSVALIGCGLVPDY
ncbi:hypothetical protein Tco_0505727 [Tanacetum coccineum]